MWARQNNEWWPAEVASVSEDGSLCVSFIGWDSRHNVWMASPDPSHEDPQLVFEPPTSSRRRAPDRLLDQMTAEGPHMAAEFAADHKRWLLADAEDRLSKRPRPSERPAEAASE